MNIGMRMASFPTRLILVVVLALAALTVLMMQPGVARATHVETCQEIVDAGLSVGDGNYVVQPNGQTFTVYCHDMAGTPRDYLTLANTGGNFNYGQYTAGGSSPGTTVKTNYTKVRINPQTLAVDIGDKTFASSVGGLHHAGGGAPNVFSMPYAVAMACIDWNNAAGKANIDLTGTPFAVADTFVVGGFQSAGSSVFNAGNQVVNITGGGYCGWNAPHPGAFNPFTFGPGTFNLDLTYTGALKLTCDGHPATIIGTNGSEFINGTNGPDVILGLGGNDTIEGKGGDDIICAGPGDDLVDGNDGNDLIFGQDGDDELWGDADDDTIYGGPGMDRILGNAGNDWISGGSEMDDIDGHNGTDTIFGDGGDDWISGGKHDDWISGGPGEDSLDGNNGNDSIFCDADADEIYGGRGNDTLSGGEGNDFIDGETDDDIIVGGPGNDLLIGNKGNDLIGVFAFADFFGPFPANGVEEGDDEIYGSQGNDWITGGPGNDDLDGGPGNDVIRGHLGNDTLGGYDGDDQLYGDGGEDTMRGHGGSDFLNGGNDADFMDGGAQVDFCIPEASPPNTFVNCENIP